MRKEVENLIMELNTDSEYISVSYRSNGFWEGINLDEINLWNSDNFNEEYANQHVSAHLMKIAKHLEERANEILVEEVDKYLLSAANKIKEVDPNIEVAQIRKSALLWKLVVLGDCPSTDSFDELMGGIREDFNYVFEYAKLDVVW